MARNRPSGERRESLRNRWLGIKVAEFNERHAGRPSNSCRSTLPDPRQYKTRVSGPAIYASPTFAELHHVEPGSADERAVLDRLVRGLEPVLSTAELEVYL